MQAEEPTPADITVPGPTLLLARNEPVAITLKNSPPEATSIHWHGIELESYYDGVAGFSGTSVSTTPLIAPGESMVVRFTPPRAGTFIYHTHSHATGSWRRDFTARSSSSSLASGSIQREITSSCSGTRARATLPLPTVFPSSSTARGRLRSP